jgi:hypothetical protein
MTSDNVSYVCPAAKPVRAGTGAPDGQMAADPDRYVPVEWAPCERGGGFCVLIAGHDGLCARGHDGAAAVHGAHCYDGNLTLVCGWPQFHAPRVLRAGAHL